MSRSTRKSTFSGPQVAPPEFVENENAMKSNPQGGRLVHASFPFIKENIHVAKRDCLCAACIYASL